MKHIFLLATLIFLASIVACGDGSTAAEEDLGGLGHEQCIDPAVKSKYLTMSVKGCHGKPPGHKCPLHLEDYKSDPNPDLQKYCYPHISVVTNRARSPQHPEFHKLLDDLSVAKQSGGAWYPKRLELRDPSGGGVHTVRVYSETLDYMGCRVCCYGTSSRSSPNGIEITGPSARSGWHITVPTSWTENGKLKSSKETYLKNDLKWYMQVDGTDDFYELAEMKGNKCSCPNKRSCEPRGGWPVPK